MALTRNIKLYLFVIFTTLNITGGCRHQSSGGLSCVFHAYGWVIQYGSLLRLLKTTSTLLVPDYDLNMAQATNSHRINWICWGLAETYQRQMVTIEYYAFFRFWTVSPNKSAWLRQVIWWLSEKNSLRPKFKLAKTTKKRPWAVYFLTFRLFIWKTFDDSEWIRLNFLTKFLCRKHLDEKLGKAKKSQSVWSTNWFDVTNLVWTKRSGQKLLILFEII